MVAVLASSWLRIPAIVSLPVAFVVVVVASVAAFGASFVALLLVDVSVVVHDESFHVAFEDEHGLP